MNEQVNLIVVNCSNCESKVHASVSHVEIVDIENLGIWYELTEIARCHGCEQVIICQREVRETDTGLDDEITERHRIWPQGDLDRALPLGTPTPVTLAYEEAKRCMTGKAYASAVAMARTAMEEILKDLGAKGDSLKKRIDDIVKSEGLDPRMVEWADLIRVLGNDAVHDPSETKRISREYALEVLQMIEAFTDYLYAFQQRFERLKLQRRAQASTIPGESN